MNTLLAYFALKHRFNQLAEAYRQLGSTPAVQDEAKEVLRDLRSYLDMPYATVVMSLDHDVL
jgi:hypothetical protein